MTLYPVLFEPMLKAKVWGGDRLGHWNKPVAPGDRIGESWEIADLAATSADGGGGDAAHSVVANGTYASVTLGDLIRNFRDDILGRCPGNAFPLLIKYLDARENLSVQVHPSVEYAQKHPEAHLKFESWVILDAEPGAVIYKGVHEGVTKQQLGEHLRDGSIVDDLIAIPARPGDCHHLPSGTVHALGAGVLVAEVQTPSDTTFRLYDWGRTDRTLHIDQALACAIMSPPHDADLRRADPSAPRSDLGGTRYYNLIQHRLRAGDAREIKASSERPRVWMCLAGAAMIECPDGSFEPVPITRGSTALMPACIGRARVMAHEDTMILEATPS